jgi:hypothetical protein
MSHSLDLAIREQLGRYLTHEISLRDFQYWFVPATWYADREASPALTDLIYSIELAMAEFSHRDWTESELRDLFRSSLEAFINSTKIAHLSI